MPRVWVWLVRTDVPAPVLDRLTAFLDDEERTRAQTMSSELDRQRYIVAHGAVRAIVARQLGAPVPEIRWARGPHGKPELTGVWTGMHANLSHSGELCMVAACASRPVGVDIQRLEPRLDTTRMAARYFTPREAGAVAAARATGDHVDLFARLWARKEAVIKAGGGRLVPGLRVDVQPVDAPIVVGEPDSAAPDRYRVTDVAAPAGFRAAVALRGPEGYRVIQRQWRWRYLPD